MNITEKIDNFIAVEGKGSIRDALNVALSRLDQKQLTIERLLRELYDADEYDVLRCPHCQSTDLIGGGTDPYRCMDCKKKFASCAGVD